jgi:hypothetical protein
MVSVSTLLKYLPPFRDNEIIVKDKQAVHDIINEVLLSHEVFASDYDNIGFFFQRGTPGETYKGLFDFCKKNIAYEVETEEDQTTRSPAAILVLGHGDCKHYSGFIGGVLDALKRQGYPVDWNYRFASYDLFNTTPGHVFVVVKNGNNEIWIDPVLSTYNERLIPNYITDKKPSMLKRLSGLEVTEDIIDYPVSDYLDNTDSQSQAYKDVQTMLKYGMMNVDMSINDDLLPALEETLPTKDFSQLTAARTSLQRMAISGLGANIIHAFAKIQMFVPRAAYLSLVGLNVFGLATKLWHCIYTDDTGTKYYQPGQDKIYHAWFLVGGDWDKLLNTVRHGKTKKAILGVAPAAAAWAATAAVVIAALGTAISQILKAKQGETGINYNVDPASGMPYGTPPSASGGSIMDFIKNNPLVVVGVAAAAYLIVRKTKRV